MTLDNLIIYLPAGVGYHVKAGGQAGIGVRSVIVVQ